MKNSQIIFLSIFLASVCAIASGVLAIAYRSTKEDIRKMKEAKTDQALRTVLGDFDNNPVQSVVKIEYKGRTLNFYPAEKNGEITAYAVSSNTAKGYAGKLTVMAAISRQGKIGTVIVTEHNETPGLGTIATDRKRTKTIGDLLSGRKDDSLPPNPLLDSFRGKDCSSAPWKLKKDGGQIDSITGATISSAAILDAVNFAAKAFHSKKTELNITENSN